MLCYKIPIRKKVRKRMKKSIVVNSLLALTVPFVIVTAPVAHAEKLDLNELIAIQVGDDSLKIDVNELGDNTFEFKSYVNGEHRQTATVKQGDDFITLDGKKINIEKYVDEKLKEENGIMAKSNYDPVYQVTLKIDLQDNVAEISDICNCILLVVAVAASGFMGGAVALTKTVLSKRITKWAGAVGLGTWFGTKLPINGVIEMPQYRTSGKVPTGLSGRDAYAYRFQNTKVTFTLLKHEYSDTFDDVGSWFFAERPI